ncbi:hypothetical protein V2J09_009537 [Rumex salicifolius]
MHHTLSRNPFIRLIQPSTASAEEETIVLLEREPENKMDKFFNSAYRGDPGVPHSGPDRFVNVWIGSVAFSVLSHFYPYMWQLTNQHNIGCLKFPCSSLTLLPVYWLALIAFKIILLQDHPARFFGSICNNFGSALMFEAITCSWHDRAMVYEQYHWKKAMAKKQPYNFKWNQMDKEVRESYYLNWPYDQYKK